MSKSPSQSQSQDFYQITNRTQAPVFERTLQAHRSLSNQGFGVTILIVAVGLTIPLLAFLGTVLLWALLPFLAVAFVGLWYSIRRNDHDGTLCEVVRMWPDLIAVHRKNPRAPDQFWHANPHWVTIHLRDTRTVENYLTVKGNGREIELGAFLSPEARKEVWRELEHALRHCGKT
jgi:uncharacterized membrane protein